MHATMIRFLGVVVPVAAMVGCGAAEGGPVPVDEAEIGQIAQKFDEASCATTSADVSLGTNGSSTSPDGSYNHATCTNAYIGTMTSFDGYHAYAAYQGSVVPPSWGCNGMWATVSVWKWNGSSYVHQSTSTSYGAQFGTSCLAPKANIDIAGSSASYKILGAAGYVFTYVPVAIGGEMDPH